jgi:acetyl-CoA carboxylase carboxyl transferase subunit beta
MVDISSSVVHDTQVKVRGSDTQLAQAQSQKIAGTIFIKCPNCRELLYWRIVERNKKVCSQCRYHFQLSASERLEYILDEGSFHELDVELKTGDPLRFVHNNETYLAKATQTRKKTGFNEALITGLGTIERWPLAIAVAEFSFLGASMGCVFGEKLVRLIDRAIEHRLPLLTISCSGGARMQEGIFSLMQMAKIIAALADLSWARLPHISFLTNPCYGGVTASYASVADIILAEPGALIGFAGPRVIEQVTQQKLPARFQTAEFLLEHGMIDSVVPRSQLRMTLGNLLHFFRFCS